MQNVQLNLVQDLMRIIPNTLKPGIQQLLSQSQTQSNAKIILNLCRVITQKIDIYIKHQYNPQENKYYTLYKRKNDIDAQTEQDLMIYGGQLIYLLRSFITNEEIVYHMASRDSLGKYQADAFIPQKEILQHLSVVKANAVGVSINLQKALIQKHTNDFIQTKRKNLWKRVEYLSEAVYRPGKNIAKIDMRSTKETKAHWAYQSQKKDNSIYLKFSGGKQRTLNKYYDVIGDGKKDSLQHFNNGWLWEWYNSILYGGSDIKYTEVTTAIQHGSLLPIIKEKDYTPGTKQGDFQTLSGQQVQSKYGSSKIISYNNIRNIIYNLEQSLSLFVANNNSVQAQKKLLEVLQEHFIPNAAKNGNAFANDITKQLLQKFTQSTLKIQIK